MLSTPDAICSEPSADHAAAGPRITIDGTAAVYALLAAAVALAWTPMCTRYVPVADDIGLGHDLALGLLKYLYDAPHSPTGVWRCVGYSIVGKFVNHPDWYGPAIVTLHAAVTCLFLKLARQLLQDFRLAMLLALAFGVYPVIGQAITWAAAAPIVIIEGVFLLLLLWLLHIRDLPRWQLPGLAIAFTVAFAVQLVQENLVFAFAALGGILWIPETRFTFRQLGRLTVRRYSGFGPIGGAAAFVLLWHLFPGSNPVKETQPLRPLSALTPYLRVDAAALTFAPWLSHDTRSLLAWGWSPSMTVVLIAAIAGIVCAACLLRKRPIFDPASACRPTFSLLAMLLTLSLGVSIVYAAAGGFSLDSRKQYVLMPQALLVLGWLIRRANLKLDRVVLPVALGIIITGVPSSWLYINVWRHESFCLAALCRTAIDNNISGPTQIRWTPDIYRAWPGAVSSWGFRFDEAGIMEPPFATRGLPRIKRAASNAPITFTFDPARNGWHIGRTSSELTRRDPR